MPPSCLSGGGRAYKLELEIIKSPLSSSSSSTCWASRLSSSPSPTLSESSNSSSVALSTRKPRTPRKRPNQTYHEAAALLSTAYPAIFTNPPPCNAKFFAPSPENPFSGLHYAACDDDDTFLLPPPPLLRASVPCKLLAGWEIESNSRPIGLDYCEDFREDFDAGSILDGGIEEGGIDSIMGKLGGNENGGEWMGGATSYGFPIGMMGFKAAIKKVDGDNGDYWRRFPSVNVVDITPKPEKSAPAPEKMKKNKKKKKVEKAGEFQKEERSSSSSAQTQSAALSKEDSGNNIPNPKSTLLLKLNHHSVLTEWMDRPSPFSDETPFSEATGTDVQTRLAQIDLFSESGVREASVLRYKEKRRTRLFSKKIRYQVRKVNADLRPRMKGRFMKSPNSPDDNEQG